MTTESSLYWVYLETDIKNEDLYLPPDTPVEFVKSDRLYKILKVRHARQRQRLIKQQVAELNEYQTNFSIQYQQDLFIKSTTTACEFVSGMDFLTSHNEAISELLENIPTYIATSHTYHEKKDKSEGDKFNERKLEYINILKKKFKTGLEVIEKAHQSQLDVLSELQKADLSVIPADMLDPVPHPAISRERSRDSRISSTSPPVSSSRNRHQKVSPSPPTNNNTTDNSGSRNVTNRNDWDEIKRKRRQDNEEDTVDKSRQKALQPPPGRKFYSTSPYSKTPPNADNDQSTAATSPKIPRYVAHSGADKVIANGSITASSSKTPHYIAHPGADRPMASSSKTPQYIAHPGADKAVANGTPTAVSAFKNPPVVGNGAPPVGSSYKKASYNNRNGPPVSYKKSPSVPHVVGIPSGHGPPTVAGSSSKPPVVGTPAGNGPPTVASSSTPIPLSKKKQKKMRKQALQKQQQQQQRRSSDPLFDNNTSTSSFTTLMDSGSLIIRSKPNRVVIRGKNGTSTVYGNPKDYDDAINSSRERHDNPVYKRHMNGQDYLIYRTETGQVVTIGAVAQIQPLIQKFFLLM